MHSASKMSSPNSAQQHHAHHDQPFSQPPPLQHTMLASPSQPLSQSQSIQHQQPQAPPHQTQTHQPQHQQQLPKAQSPSQIPTQFRAISRNNSNASTASSSNRGELHSSNVSTTNSVTSSRSQLSKHQFIDHRQLLSTCVAGSSSGASSVPIRSFQRATISSVVKTRAFDTNPMLQGLLTSTPSGQNSVSNSQTPSPLSTPVFSRSRSLRMSGEQHLYNRYRQGPSNSYRASSRTPDLYSFNNSGYDLTSNATPSNDSTQTFQLSKLSDLINEKNELKESLEFLECERKVLIDSAKEIKDTLILERSQWKKDHDDLKKQVTDLIAARLKAESQLTRNDVEMNDMRLQIKKLNEQLQTQDRQLEALRRQLETNCHEERTLNLTSEHI